MVVVVINLDNLSTQLEEFLYELRICQAVKRSCAMQSVGYLVQRGPTSAVITKVGEVELTYLRICIAVVVVMSYTLSFIKPHCIAGKGKQPWCSVPHNPALYTHWRECVLTAPQNLMSFSLGRRNFVSRRYNSEFRATEDSFLTLYRTQRSEKQSLS